MMRPIKGAKGQC